ncbi:hypothetical protein D3C71_328540 [compost metagenome]
MSDFNVFAQFLILAFIVYSANELTSKTMQAYREGFVNPPVWLAVVLGGALGGNAVGGIGAAMLAAVIAFTVLQCSVIVRKVLRAQATRRAAHKRFADE